MFVLAVLQYIDFAIPNTDFKGTQFYNNTDSIFSWSVGGPGTAKMTLNPTALCVGGATASSSDTRLNFNEKRLTNALYVINQLEIVEYDEAQYLTATYTVDTPQSHQCGFIAYPFNESMSSNALLLVALLVEKLSKSIIHMNYNAVSTYAATAIHELHEVVKQQQLHIKELKQRFSLL